MHVLIFQTILTDEELNQFKPICPRLKKGEASFHHALMVHGSYCNRYTFSTWWKLSSLLV